MHASQRRCECIREWKLYRKRPSTHPWPQGCVSASQQPCSRQTVRIYVPWLASVCITCDTGTSAAAVHLLAGPHMPQSISCPPSHSCSPAGLPLSRAEAHSAASAPAAVGPLGADCRAFDADTLGLADSPPNSPDTVSDSGCQCHISHAHCFMPSRSQTWAATQNALPYGIDDAEVEICSRAE